VAVRVLRLEVPWVVLLVAALVPPLAAATVVMATITGASAATPTGMIEMARADSPPKNGDGAACGQKDARFWPYMSGFRLVYPSGMVIDALLGACATWARVCVRQASLLGHAITR
jgi:hypothetical protein